MTAPQPTFPNKRPVRVGLVVSGFPALSETFIIDQAAALTDAGLDLRILATRRLTDGLRHERARELVRLADFSDESPLVRLMPGRLKMLARRLSRRRLQRRAASECDLLLCHFGPVGLITVRNLEGVQRRPLIWTVFHGFDMSRHLAQAGPDAYAPLFRLGDRFLPISRMWADRLAGIGCPAERIALLRMGVDCAAISFAPPKRAATGRLRLLTVGRLVEKKGTEYSLRALAQVARTQPSLRWSFEIAGEGPLQRPLEALAAELGLADRVTFLGPLGGEQVREKLRRADLFLLPSVTAADGDMEGIPVALMEAMAAGVPVVTTFHSGIPELVEDGVSGLLASERDVATLARQIAIVLGDPERAHSLAAAARARVEAEFNQAKINAALVAEIEAAVEGAADAV
ncbi:MAG TPA: glycosyltransferase [Allosphingosinicella sp.]